MIRDILKLLKNTTTTDNELINIAKGKYKIPETIKEGLKQRKMK